MQPSEIPSVVRSTLDPGHFFLAPDARVRVEECVSESIPWELFRGHLLDATRTRQRKEFCSWHVHLDDPHWAIPGQEAGMASAPIVSVRWDGLDHQLHVTRNLLSRGWEAYESRPGVIESRPVLRWLPELVATLQVDPATLAPRTLDHFADELRTCVSQAWFGVSRLPITSVESPHPVFSLGRMAYLPNSSPSAIFAKVETGFPAEASPVSEVATGERTPEQLMRLAWNQPDHPDAVRRLETALRAARPGDVTAWLAAFDPGNSLRAGRVLLLQRLFHHVSLSPFTQFTQCWLELLAASAAPRHLGGEAVVDLLGYMLRHLIRHLSAYDLVTFHSFGANYPDALWLDRLFQELLARLERRPELFLEDPSAEPTENRRKRLRRRALRHGWIVRKAYEGHRVPDLPTSRGEHQRVFPGETNTVPEEQITQPATRRKRLFHDSPTDALLSPRAMEVLEASIADLSLPGELIEMGSATFLDRPFGIFKQTGEVDRTPLLAYDAASRSLVAARLAEVRRSGVGSRHDGGDVWDALVEALPIEGIAAADLPGDPRPGVIMLEDARNARPDFVIRAILPGSLRLLADTPGLWNDDQRRAIHAWGKEMAPHLLIRTATAADARRGRPWLTMLDPVGRSKAKLSLPRPGSPAYAESHGVEYLRDGITWGG